MRIGKWVRVLAVTALSGFTALAPTSAGADNNSATIIQNAVIVQKCGDHCIQIVNLQQLAIAIVEDGRAPVFNPLLRTAAFVSPESLNFGKVRVGRASDKKRVVLKNTGHNPMVITGIGFDGSHPDDFFFTQDKERPCLLPGSPFGVLREGRDCALMVGFKPREEGGRKADLVFEDNGFGGSQRVRLAGTGVEADAELTPSAHDFGSVALNHARSADFTLKSTGSDTLKVASVSVDDAASFDATACPGELEPGASCSIHVSFHPTGSEGNRNGVLSVKTDASEKELKATLTGKAVAVAELELSPSSLDFGRVNVGATSGPKDVSAKNVGTGPMTINADDIHISGANASDFNKSTDCPATLNPGKTCLIHVSFKPAAGGARNATLNVKDSTVALAGNGVAVVSTSSPTGRVSGARATAPGLPNTGALVQVGPQSSGTASPETQADVSGKAQSGSLPELLPALIAAVALVLVLAAAVSLAPALMTPRRRRPLI